jgi:hypothetical protein
MSAQWPETDAQGRSFWEENKVLVSGIGVVVLVLVCFGLGVLGILWKATQPQQIGPTPTATFVTSPVPATFTPIPTDTPPPPTDTPVLTETPTPIPTPLPEAPSCTTSVGLNIRAGPGPDYPDIGDIPAGKTVGVIGQNFRNDVVWWKIGDDSWVSGKYCMGNKEAEAVEFAPAPPTPTATQTMTPTDTPTATNTPTPTPECWAQVPNLLTSHTDRTIDFARDEARRALLEPVDDPRCFLEGDHDLEGVVTGQSLTPDTVVSCGSQIILTYFTGPFCTPTPVPVVDTDGDGLPDSQDNCPNHYNPGQWDIDQDGIGTICDSCPYEAGPKENNGCPLPEPTATPVVISTGGTYQPFENGWMFWREDIREIYAVYRSGWSSYLDTWQEGQDEYSCPETGAPSQSPPTPKRGFGKLWCELGGPSAAIGWALAAETGYTMQIRVFSNGDMEVLDPDGRVFIVRADGTCQCP